MVGVVHHGVEDVDVPAVQTHLEQAALPVDELIANAPGDEITLKKADNHADPAPVR
jgi:hypothetical protein